jgi:hypothetical protein
MRKEFRTLTHFTGFLKMKAERDLNLIVFTLAAASLDDANFRQIHSSSSHEKIAEKKRKSFEGKDLPQNH